MPRNPGDRCDDLILLLPRVLAVIGAEHIAGDHLEERSELFLQLALAPKAEVRQSDDQRALHKGIFSSLSSKPAMMVVVGQEEPGARHAHEVVVDGLKLVRQWIDAGDGSRSRSLLPIVPKDLTPRLG
jgi:hypothetical protein